MPNGTQNSDTFTAPAGVSTFNGFGGVDTLILNFALVDATFTRVGNQLIIHTPTGDTVTTTGFEVFQFTDGTVHNDDGSPLIDDLFYYSQYHDVWNAHVDADAHYDTFGWHEERDPNAFFRTRIYLIVNPDVADAGVNPLTHFHEVGWTQGRDPGFNFDIQKYLAANPDVAAAHIDPLAHFLAFGASEGRQPFSVAPLTAANGFDYVYYMQHNPDVAAAGVDPFWHFQNFGWKEGRNPNAYFDTLGYLASNPDIAAAHVNPLDHFHAFGWSEGRNPSPSFDTALYLLHNPDVAAAHVDPFKHFLQFGIQEGRVAYDSPLLDRDDTVNAILEGAANGTHVGVTASWGGWVSPGLTYTKSGDTSLGGFAVDPHTGVITVADGTLIDFENAPGHAYSVTVQAHDGTATVSHTFVIAAADAAPTTDNNLPVGNVNELATNGTAVGINFDLADPNGPVATYKLTDDAGGRFTIDANGDVRVADGAAIDYDTAPGHAYTIIAKGTVGAQSITQTYTIVVNDVNDNAPQISSGATFSVAETTTAVGTITSTDVDSTGEATHYTLGGADAALFSIGDTSGVLAFNAPKDYESDKHVYSIRVTASDGTNSSFQDITVYLTGTNDTAPVIGSAAAFNVAEGTTTVGTVASTDADSTGETTHYTVSGTDASLFSIGDTSGVLTFNAPKDYESDKHVYAIRVTASDGTNSSFQDITINLTDVNDNAPQITSDTAFSVVENTTAVATVTSTDADSTGETTHYTVSGADAAFFSIGDTSGVLTFNAPKDYENDTHVYAIRVTASDGTSSSFQDITVNLTDTNDNAPAIGSAAAFNVAEGTTAVGTVTSTDTDSTGETTHYTLGGTDAALFSIDDTSGVLTFKAPKDYESDKHLYSIRVIASDGTNSSFQDVIVNLTDVNDRAPQVTSDATFSVAENTTAVGTVTSTDADSTGETTHYTLGGTDAALFSIDDTSGVLTFKAPKDYESDKHAYSIRVAASDGTNSSFQDITVNLTDVNDNAPQVTSDTAFSVAENTTAVATVTSADADSTGETTHYTLSGTDASLFSIGDTSGVLIFNAPKDYENDKHVYSVRVTASDGANSSFQDITVNLADVNDNAPQVTSDATFGVAETTTAVGTVTSNDADTTGETTHYTLSGTDASLFSIGDTSGVLTFNAPKDHESDKHAYSIRVIASDGTNPSFQDITVNLTDVNDSAPQVTSDATFSVAENTTAVATVTSTDADSTGETTHYTVSGGDASLFAIGDTSGVLTFNAPKDYETDTHVYSIRVVASDGTNSSFQDITVNLTDVDDAPPNNPPVATASTNGSVSRDVSFEIPSGNAVINGGFEQGLNDFPPVLPGWTFGGARSAHLSGGSDSTHSGNRALTLGFNPTSVTQSIWTVAGVHYTLEFWLQNQDLQTRPNDFTVSWNGTVLETFTDVPPGFGSPFIKHTYEVVGIGGAVDLSFFGEGTGWGLDDISLTAVGTVTPGTETTSGTVTFTDVDAVDTHTVSFVAKESGYVGTFTPTLGTDSTGGVPGTVNWTFSVADSALASIAAQQSVIQTYTVTVDDGRGGRASRDVLVTLTNPDHAPVITGSTDGSIARDGSHVTPSGNLLGNPGFESGLAVWSMPTGGQVSGPGNPTNPLAHSGEMEYVASSGGPTILSQSFATTAGVEYLVDFWLTNSDGNGPNSVQILWDGAAVGSLTNVPGTFTGFSVAYTHYTYHVVATASSSTLTLSFQNDNSHFFLDDVSVSTVPDTESTFGTLTFTDIDTIDIHTVSYVPRDQNYVGSFTPTIAAGSDSTGGQNGTVKWTFSIPDSALGFLSAQQSVVQTYSVTVADNHGGTATRDVAVTLTNPDHAPVITSGPQSVVVLEDYSFTVPIGNVVQNGGFETASPDQNGRYTIIPGWTGANFLYLPQLGTAPHSGQGVVDFATYHTVGTWSQSVPTVAGVHYTLSFWAAAAFSPNNSIAVSWNGQTVLARSNVQALAGHNPTGPGDYTQYTVDVVGQAGSSDLVFSLATDYYWFLDDVSVAAVGITPGTETTRGTVSFTDGDASDTHTVSVAPNSNIGTFSASLDTDSSGGQTGTVNWTYSVADSALSFLAAQQPLDQTFTVIINDGHGGTASETVTIRLTGVNDAPTVAHPIADQIAPTNAPFSFQLSADTFHDADSGDTIALTATLEDGSALPAWLHFDAATGTFSSAAAPTGVPIIVKVTATDGSNASVSDTFTIVLPEPNHAPELVGEVLTKTSSQNIHALGTALVLDGHFGPGLDANIAQSNTIPHVSIAATAGNGLDYYKFTVTAGARGIFDIDGGLDTVIDLLDSNGTLITWNDDSSITDGGGGSPINNGPDVTYDSFLDYTFTTGGTYYLVVGGYNGGNSTPASLISGQTYQLHVSLSHPVQHVLDSYIPARDRPATPSAPWFRRWSTCRAMAGTTMSVIPTPPD